MTYELPPPIRLTPSERAAAITRLVGRGLLRDEAEFAVAIQVGKIDGDLVEDHPEPLDVAHEVRPQDLSGEASRRGSSPPVR